jgi:transcriptional antiterminator RfaH
MSYRSGAANTSWYAIRTRPKQESRAENNLSAWKVEVFYPKVQERRRHPYLGTPMYVTKALFPGYLFVRFDADRLLQKIYFTRGVHSVVSFGGQVAPIDNEIIEFIQSQVNEEGFVRIGEELKVGDRVRVNYGPLKSLAGVFERELKDSERIMILFETVGYQGRLVIAKEQVVKNETIIRSESRCRAHY